MIVVAKHPANEKWYSSEAITAIKKWLEDAGLALAENKTEAFLIKKRRRKTTAPFKTREHIITSKPGIKYLEITIETRLNFNQHL